MCLVISHLFGTAAGGLVDGLAHGIGDGVGIHNDLALGISGGTTSSLRQRTFRAKEAFLVSIQDGYQTHLGQIQSLTQKVDTDQHIKFTHTKALQDFHTFHSIHVGMDVARLDFQAIEIGIQLLGHAFGQSGYEHTLVLLHHLMNLINEVVNLIQARTHLNQRV